MANTFPYVASGGPIIKAVEHLRRSFPKELSADTLRKLGVAPNNESYVINVLRFLGVIDAEGKKVAGKTEAFVQHEDKSFQTEFEKLVQEAYAELFDLRGPDAWTLDRAALIQFFRTSDHSTEIVGQRQASTFMALSSLAGRGAITTSRETGPRPKTTKAAPATKTNSTASDKAAAKSGKVPGQSPIQQTVESKVGLTVRIEVNLPADGDQKTYDSIFQSIRKHLIDGG